jgi:hypothetical protein
VRKSAPLETPKRPNADGTDISRDFQSVREVSQDGSENVNLISSHANLDAWTLRKPQRVAQCKFDREAATELCDYCGGPATPADCLKPWNWPGQPASILLHQRCEEPWFDSERGEQAK